MVLFCIINFEKSYKCLYNNWAITFFCDLSRTFSLSSDDIFILSSSLGSLFSLCSCFDCKLNSCVWVPILTSKLRKLLISTLFSGWIILTIDWRKVSNSFFLVSKTWRLKLFRTLGGKKIPLTEKIKVWELDLWRDWINLRC